MANAAVVYSRQFGDRVLSFEPSGGLINASLVLQDRETDTYWSIMNNTAVSGELSGTRLVELPVAFKVQWGDWTKRYPQTLVLSVAGAEDAAPGYLTYFNSALGFRGIRAKDKRLPDKESVYTFEFQGKKYAIRTSSLEGGKQIEINHTAFFFFRPPTADIFYSTKAFFIQDDRFIWENEGWTTERNECWFNIFDVKFSGSGPDCPQLMSGFDTFWYIWSLVNPETEIIQ